MTRDVALSRRVVCGGALAAALGGDTAGGGIARRLTAAATVLIATDEPRATYHVAPLLAEAARRGMRLIQLVPDCSRIAPGDPVPVATPAHAPPADLLVVAGAGDWPADCAAGFPRIPVAASSFAYQPPVEARRAGEIRRRLRLITSSSRVEGLAFGARLGVDGVVRVVGSAQADALPHRVPQHGLVLVLTSVTDQDSTGSAAPGTELLLAATDKLAAAGKRILDRAALPAGGLFVDHRRRGRRRGGRRQRAPAGPGDVGRRRRPDRRIGASPAGRMVCRVQLT